MRNVWTIARRELYAYFNSPIAYVTSAAFLGIMGLAFTLIVAGNGQAAIEPTLNFALFFLILYAAVVTMRLLAEEQRSGTIELVLTAPVRDWELVLGKYLGSVILFLAMMAVSLYQVLILLVVGEPEMGTTASAYLGFILVGMSLLAVGTLSSALTRNQVVASILSIALGGGLWLVEYLGQLVGQLLSIGFLSEFLTRLGIFYHYFESFQLGLIDTEHVVYYVSLVAACLFLATRVVETRRWR